MNLRSIQTFKQLVRYLEDELDWPLEGHDIEDLTFDYEPDELGLKPAEAAKVKAIRQLRPLDSKQPWGIFFIEFDRKKLPVVVLRRILSHLVVKKRASANKAHRAAWHAEDLLFISAFGAEDDGREISFAHFHQEEGDMPTLHVLGWDGGDTKLKLDHLDTTLREKLHWPENKESLDAWRARWSGVFCHRIGHVINTSDMLAEAMAVLAKRIRDAAQHLLHIASEEGIALEETAAWAIAKGADGGMRDAQSMLDQLVSFCGDSINEANVLDVFGFTSREKVAALTQTLLARDNPAALSLIQKEAESGRELSQLLGELIGCLRALLVAKLDPSADGEGIPAHLWTALLQAADEYAPDRILAAIDVFAETEGRMKWATNKRLHFELGVIKAIQSLGEVRITDVIKVLTRGADFIPTGALASAGESQAAAPTKAEPVTTKSTPDPLPLPVANETIPEPTPEPAPVVAKPRISGGLSSFDSLIDAAPDVSEPPAAVETPPWKNDKPAAEAKPLEPVPVVSALEDAFHNDPLIQSALVKFEGKVLA